MQKVLVLMSTYNGEKYIREQIESILHQKEISVDLLVRDDGSTDNTIEILKEYHVKGALHYSCGDNLLPAKSFMTLVMNASNKYDFYAFSDQDDIWIENKLKTAIDYLSWCNEKPALYYCATDIVDENLTSIGRYFRDNTKANSLVASLLSGSLIPGCTMVFNQKLHKHLIKYMPECIGMHDHWVHLICLALDGIVYGDNIQHIKYRQHQTNVVGAGKKKFLVRIRRLLKKSCVYSRICKEILEGYQSIMDENTKKNIKIIVDYQKKVWCKFELLKICWSSLLSRKEKILATLKIIFNFL